VLVLPLLLLQAPELPPGPAAEALARIGPGTVPAELATVPPGAWDEPGTWRAWAELLAAESRGHDRARRARLAQLALAQERHADAWNHFAACAGSPEVLAALLPRFLPGGSPGPRPDGALLAPAMPPASLAPPPPGRIDRRAMRSAPFRVGEAQLSMSVAVEYEGVQIELRHLEGGPCRVRLRIPRDEHFEVGVEHVDWYRQEGRGVAHELALSAEDPERTLFARFEPRAPAWPTHVPERLPAGLADGGLWLACAPGDPARALLEEVAASLSSLPLGVRAGVGEPLDERGGRPGVRVDLRDARARPRKLAWLAGAVERRLLPSPD